MRGKSYFFVSQNSALDNIVYTSEILDNALRVSVTDPLNELNIKTYRCYAEQGTISMPDGCIVALRKPILYFDKNNIVIELYETSPTYGRIWINKYAQNVNKWYGWKCVTSE